MGGTTNDCKLEQPEKAAESIIYKFSLPQSTVTKLVQPKKALLPISLQGPGITIFCIPVKLANKLDAIVANKYSFSWFR